MNVVSSRNSMAVMSRGLTAASDLAAREVHVDVAELVVRSAPRPRGGGARLDPRTELERAEGLRDVIIRAELQAEDLLGLLGLGRQHDDGRGHTGTSELPADGKAILLRQHDVSRMRNRTALPARDEARARRPERPRPRSLRGSGRSGGPARCSAHLRPPGCVLMCCSLAASRLPRPWHALRPRPPAARS